MIARISGVQPERMSNEPVDRRAMRFAKSILLDRASSRVLRRYANGCIIMAIPHSSRQRDLFTTQNKWVAGDRHLLTAWQVLVISRLWIEPSVQVRQADGHATNIGSCATSIMLRQLQADWLEHHPPVFPERTYHIRLILAHADTGAGHEGKVYQAANFQHWGMTQRTKARETSRGSGVRAPSSAWEFIGCLILHSLMFQNKFN